MISQIGHPFKCAHAGAGPLHVYQCDLRSGLLKWKHDGICAYELCHLKSGQEPRFSSPHGNLVVERSRQILWASSIGRYGRCSFKLGHVCRQCRITCERIFLCKFAHHKLDLFKNLMQGEIRQSNTVPGCKFTAITGESGFKTREKAWKHAGFQGLKRHAAVCSAAYILAQINSLQQIMSIIPHAGIHPALYSVPGP